MSGIGFKKKKRGIIVRNHFPPFVTALFPLRKGERHI